jgi:hypothetical protein
LVVVVAVRFTERSEAHAPHMPLFAVSAACCIGT